jgi:hypothetical protein
MIKNILLIPCVYLTASNCEILKNKCISARNLNPGILSHQYLTKGLNGYCQESYSNNVIGGDGSLFYDKYDIELGEELTIGSYTYKRWTI